MYGLLIIFKLVAHTLESLFVPVRIAVIKELGVTVMGAVNTLSMFDWAPVLFSTCHYLLNVGQDSVAIAAIDAVEFFNQVEVGKLMPIDDEVVPTAYPRDTIGAEADVLIGSYRQINNQYWKDHSIDDRRSEYIQWSGMAQVA